MPPPAVDVLIVGAGPTGLALAAQLQRFGAQYRIVDRSLDRAHESRALGVQARTLECLDAIGLADLMVKRGRSSTRAVIHAGAREIANVPIAGLEGLDTRYPFILILSQAVTEQLLGDYLRSAGVTIDRGTELISFTAGDADVECVLRDPDGAEERVRARYLVACDGARSSVRRDSGVAFDGGSYPQTFALGDVEASGPLQAGAINAFAGDGGIAIFFPLGQPTTWRVIAVSATLADDGRGDGGALTSDLSLAELQSLVDTPAQGSVRLRDPAWVTRFHLHHRQVAHYRIGRIFLAGDAAHIHSPVGAQGMNTGIQDAWNLGWKLGLVLRGVADDQLLDTYESERWPVGRFLLRFTDRLFATLTRVLAPGRGLSWIRTLVPRVVPFILRRSWPRSLAFRFASELTIRYGPSTVAEDGTPRLRHGPRAGSRLPDRRLTINGESVYLQRAVAGARFSLILCGDTKAWDGAHVRMLRDEFDSLLGVQYLSSSPTPGVLCDDGATLRLLGAEHGAQYLVRPDGYIAYRAGGYNLSGLARFLERIVHVPSRNPTAITPLAGP
jgi:2-polyprenyl-6-methoxyphenol hydroxylase-like FAD-dependent oxidoreductase